MASLQFELYDRSIVRDLIDEELKFVYNPDKEEIQVLFYGEPDQGKVDELKEIADVYGWKLDSGEFQISDYLKEQYHAEKGIFFTFQP